MQKHEIEMWETNIENAASRVAAEYGSAVVNSVFARYDATGLMSLQHGHPISRNTLFSRLSAVRNGLAGNWLKAALTVSIQTKLQSLKLLQMLEISPRDLDADCFALCTPEATYDLRKGIAGAREHSAEDFITKITSVSPSQKGMPIMSIAD